ncbi:MAG: phosphatase PAP2 family protein [Nitrospinota bacterium]
MFSALLSLDVKSFRVLNAIDWPEWVSATLSVLARSNLWVAPIALAFLLLAVLGGQRGRTYVLTALLTLALTELIVSAALKPLIGRLRPCHALEGVRLVGGCTQSFAMPSGHAANSFAQATVLGLFYRPSFLLSLPPVALVALSRVTDGKHYPSDVIVGVVLGIFVAAFLVRAIRPRLEAAQEGLSRRIPLADRVLNLESAEVGRPTLVFWTVLAAATAIRLWYVGWADLMPEEAVYWDRARFVSGWGWLFASPAEGLGWIGAKWFGDTELGVRVGALVASLLTSILLFVWAKRAFPWSRWAGALAGIGLLAAPVFGIGGAHLIAVTLSLLFWTGALAAMDLSSSGPAVRSPWMWGAWGLCAGLAIRTGVAGALLVPLSGLFLVLSSRARQWLKRPAPYLGFALALILGASPWVAGESPWTGPSAEAKTGGLMGFLNWHLIHLGPLLLAFLIWGVFWGARRSLRDRGGEYSNFVCFTLIFAIAFFAVSWVGGVEPHWAAAGWIPAWMATVGAATEILRRGSRQSLRLAKVVGLVLLMGVLQTTLILNIRLLEVLDVKIFPKQDPAAQIMGWRSLGERVSESLKEMGGGTIVLTDDHGTAAELSFYARPHGTPAGSRVRVVSAHASPLMLPGGLKGRRALLVLVGEWTEPPKSIRPVFRSWQREDLFLVRRRRSGVIRSVTLFRLHDYTGPPASGGKGSEKAL